VGDYKWRAIVPERVGTEMLRIQSQLPFLSYYIQNWKTNILVYSRSNFALWLLTFRTLKYSPSTRSSLVSVLVTGSFGVYLGFRSNDASDKLKIEVPSNH
jgi:hypothetical protein